MLDLDNTTIIVTGTPRSGTTLMMRMLNMGGIPALVDIDSMDMVDEHAKHGSWEMGNAGPRIQAGGPEFTNGKVVKLLAPMIMFWPFDRATKGIYMKRNLSEVSASMLAAQRIWDITPYEMAEIARSFINEMNLPLLYVDYNDLIKYPRSTCERIIEYLDYPLDIEEMVKLVNKPKEERRGTLQKWDKDKVMVIERIDITEDDQKRLDKNLKIGGN